MPNQEQNSDVGRTSALKVWDTQYCAPSKAFPFFREGVCSTFMPWSPEHKADQSFEARIESVVLDSGSAAHVVMTPLVASRTKSNVADSPMHGFYGNYVLSGEVQVEQAGRTTVGKAGDLIIYDTALPLTLTERGRQHYEDLAFFFPRSCFAISQEAEQHLRNVVLTHDRMIRPLSSCLTYLAGSMSTASKDELQALFEACASLLPVAAGCYDKREQDESELPPSSNMLRDILEFVNRNISDVDLSPRRAAEHFGISARYVHKLFAVSSTTFSSYVLAKRLEHIRGDLLSSSCRNQPISILAYRWGFNDLSSFNRAFKNRFGCSPSQFRVHFVR
jgi:AraC-like DNA-binding protein